MKERKAEQLFKDRTEVFAKSYFDLFGDSFRVGWCSSLKLKQIYEEIIKNKWRVKGGNMKGDNMHSLLKHHRKYPPR